jgi:hypothetical protein
MPYRIEKDGDKFSVIRMSYGGETGPEKKVATTKTRKDANLYIAFAEKKMKEKDE